MRLICRRARISECVVLCGRAHAVVHVWMCVCVPLCARMQSRNTRDERACVSRQQIAYENVFGGENKSQGMLKIYTYMRMSRYISSENRVFNDEFDHF